MTTFDGAPNANLLLKRTGNLPGTFNDALMTSLNFDPIINQGDRVVSDVIAGPVSKSNFPYKDGYLRITESRNRHENYDPDFEFVLYPKPVNEDSPPHMASDYIIIKYGGGAVLKLATIPPSETLINFMRNDKSQHQIELYGEHLSRGNIRIDGRDFSMNEVQRDYKSCERLFLKLYGVSIRPYLRDGIKMIELKMNKGTAGLEKDSVIQIPMVLSPVKTPHLTFSLLPFW